MLECFQAGLSWETILNKRENFRRGSATVYAFMQSVGMVNDHLPERWKSRRAR